MTTIDHPSDRLLESASSTGFEVPLPYAPESVGKARRLVKRVLRSWQLSALVDDAVLVTSELMTNACQTGCRRHITFSITRTAALSIQIAVRDGSRYPPTFVDAGPPKDADHVAPHGRGLLVVNSLAQQWGLTTSPLGKTVYAHLRQRPSR